MADESQVLKLLDEAQRRAPQETVELLYKQPIQVISKVLGLRANDRAGGGPGDHLARDDLG